MENNYRILKTKFGFTVQLEVTRIKRGWFVKTYYKDWVSVNHLGREQNERLPFSERPISPDCYPIPPFRTKKEARKFIRRNSPISGYNIVIEALKTVHLKGGYKKPNPPDPPKGRTITSEG